MHCKPLYHTSRPRQFHEYLEAAENIPAYYSHYLKKGRGFIKVVSVAGLNGGKGAKMESVG